jgi:AraC-like DNA-binding protein
MQVSDSGIETRNQVICPPNIAPSLKTHSESYTIFEQMPDIAFFTKNEDRRFETANHAFARLCGVKLPQDLLGGSSRDFFESQLAALYDRWDLNVLRSGLTSLNRFYRANNFRGESRWLFGTRMLKIDLQTEHLVIVGHARIMPRFRNSHQIYRRLEIATDAITGSLCGPLNATSLAQEAGCSVSQLNRDFGRILGITPNAYLGQLRLRRCRELIRTGCSLAQAALDGG